MAHLELRGAQYYLDDRPLATGDFIEVFLWGDWRPGQFAFRPGYEPWLMTTGYAFAILLDSEVRWDTFVPSAALVEPVGSAPELRDWERRSEA